MGDIIVREYIESLNESKELDYIFPILLESMGFRLVTTPVDSKGQPQYGKDIVAIRKDEDGNYYKYYFELKGFFAKDINDKTYFVQDGFRDSILAAKDTAFRDSSIPRFNDLPVKIVYVHNGVLIENTRNTYDGFVSKEFPNGNFERWDIYKLTGLFSEYLFNEYLLTDTGSVRLFKRTLVLLDAPDNDFEDYKQLVKKQLGNVEEASLSTKSGKREISKMFASLKLITAIVYKFSKENNNLYPAKRCIDYTVLHTWSWVLRNKYEQKSFIIKNVNSLVILQQNLYHEYIAKTLPLAMYPKGLYAFTASISEVVCYPLRCFDYLNDLVYFYYLSNAYTTEERYREIINAQKDNIKKVIASNSGCTSVLLDNHSITIHLVVLFLLRNNPTEDDKKFIAEYIFQLTCNLISTYRKRGRLPELHSNKLELAKSYHAKTDDYSDKSSLLILFLFELLAYINAQYAYAELKTVVKESGINLQIAYPINDIDIEQLLFEKYLYDEISVATSIEIPDTVDEFKKKFRKKYNSINYRTDRTGFDFLRILAHIYYKTDFFPDQLNVGFCEELSKK